MRKEYNDRWNAPLVNPPITHGEYMAQRAKEGKLDTPIAPKTELKTNPKSVFIPTIDGDLAASG